MKLSFLAQVHQILMDVFCPLSSYIANKTMKVIFSPSSLHLRKSLGRRNLHITIRDVTAPKEEALQINGSDYEPSASEDSASDRNEYAATRVSKGETKSLL
ncbi:hypothetical protein NPIL_481421 [Nephila pilipes]|uniref:Uncharacterized protein n=1 Tax=Nephila pilipes TaxID=299642 RepID=A0A8X6N6V9_NEPPI|nr:hypothetical protein NPIL_481421 [Nephila pilipes]